jgi:hypothetical protein
MATWPQFAFGHSPGEQSQQDSTRVRVVTPAAVQAPLPPAKMSRRFGPQEATATTAIMLAPVIRPLWCKIALIVNKATDARLIGVPEQPAR